MILSDGEILQHIEEGTFQIQDFNKDNLTPNGYDLTIEAIERNPPGITIPTNKDGILNIPKGAYFRVLTKEFVVLLPNMTAQLWLRSSYARRGVMATFGYVDAGFKGKIVCSCYNSFQNVELKIGDTICQIVFEWMSSKANKAYNGKYQNQKDFDNIKQEQTKGW